MRVNVVDLRGLWDSVELDGAEPFPVGIPDHPDCYMTADFKKVGIRTHLDIRTIIRTAKGRWIAAGMPKGGGPTLHVELSTVDAASFLAAGRYAVELPDAIKDHIDRRGPTFLPSPLQARILRALDGKALRGKALMKATALSGQEETDGSNLYKALAILRAEGRVQHSRQLGYVRPDAMPPPRPNES